MSNLIISIILGLVQGTTEFLPVSSSGHLVILQAIIPGFKEPGLLYDLVLHLATLLAVLIYFRRDIFQIISGWLSNPLKFSSDSPSWLGWLIIIGTIPTGIIGVSFESMFKHSFERPMLAAGCLLITGTLLVIASTLTRKATHSRILGIKEALIIGLAQGLAILPGISRSGSTISVALLLGISAMDAARFSFLLSIPSILAAGLFEARDLVITASASQNGIMFYSIGFLAAAIIGYISIAFLLKVLIKGHLHYFGYYCWLSGGGFIIYYALMV